MKLVFWLSLAAVLYTYAGYPLIMFMLSRLHSRPWLREQRVRSVSVIMAVHNGARLLREQMAHLLSLDPEYVREVIIVSDGSNDGTEEILGGTLDARVRAIILPEQGG